MTGQRSCDECTACTDRWPHVENVDGLKSRCIWKNDPQGIMLSEELRPDKSGVILIQGRDENGGDCLGVCEVERNAAQRAPWPDLLHGMDQHMTLVHENVEGKQRRMRVRSPLVNHAGVLPFLEHRNKKGY